MTNEIDMSKVVLWQYDNAKKFLKLLRMKEDLANYMVKDVWDWYQNHLFGIWLHEEMDEYDKFGLWVWGSVLGIPRPLKTDGSAVSDIVYLHILKAWFFLMNADGSAATLNKYLSLVFDAGEGSGHPGHTVSLIDNYDMTIRYTFNWIPTDDETALISADWILPHPTGVMISSYEAINSNVFGFDGYRAPFGDKMVELTDRTYYGHVTANGVAIEYTDLCAHEDGDRLEVYTADDGDYYYIIKVIGGVSVRVRVGSGTPYAIFWQPDVSKPISDDTELTQKVDPDSFVYDYNGKTLVATTLKDKEGHPLERDTNGWFYRNGVVKVYVYAQNLGTFNSSVFKPESGESE